MLHILGSTTRIFFIFLFILANTGFIPVFSQDIKTQRIADLPGRLDEASGLIYTSKGLFCLGDEDDPEIYKVDTATGEITKTIIIKNASFKDKESLTADDNYLYISDFGNNKGHRKDLKIVRIELSAINNADIQEMEGEIISFHYPEQKRFDQKKKHNAFDCEAMISIDDSLYLFTKQRSDRKTTMYALPKEPGNYAAQKKDVFDAKGRVTGAALSPDGNTLLLLGYQKKHWFPFLWIFKDTGDGFFNGEINYYLLAKHPEDWQTEGITFIDDNKVLICNEESDDKKQGLYFFYLSEIE